MILPNLDEIFLFKIVVRC